MKKHLPSVCKILFALLFFITIKATAQPVPSNFYKPKVDFITGSAPRSVSIGDVDGDGKPDLVVANHNSNTVSILRNTSTIGGINPSSFAPKVDFITGTGPISVALGDIDGDGKPDLAVVNLYSRSVSIFRNTSTSGNIAFAPKIDFITSAIITALSTSVAISDLDGDGKPDLAISNISSNTLAVFRNTSTTGSITFAVRLDFTTGDNPQKVAIGDVDGDGKPDVVVTNLTSNNISVFRNNSTLGFISFFPKADFITGTNPLGIAIGDVDGDGKSDVLVTSQNSNTINVLRNTSTPGTISFAAKVDFITSITPTNIAISDVDGDGKKDVVVTNYDSHNISVLRNTSTVGTINFAVKVDFATGTNPIAIAIRDLDGDGIAEVVVANYGSNTISVFQTRTSLITDYYRTIQSGNWNAVTTWESSPDNVNWYPATLTPDFNANTITVRSPHRVEVTANLLTDQTTINSGGILVINPGITLSVNDGPGFDFTNNGQINISNGSTLLFKSVNTGASDAGTASLGPTTLAFGGIGWAVSYGSGTSGGITVERYISAPFARSAWRLLTAPFSISGSITPGINNNIYDNWQNGGVNIPGRGTTVTGPVYNGVGGVAGAPVPGANGLDYFTIGPSMQSWDRATQTLQPVTNTKTTRLFGESYFIYINGDRMASEGSPNQTTLSARGFFPLFGDVTLPTSTTPDAFTLIGNPYISPVDLNLLRISNPTSNIKTTYYYWDPYLTGAYGVGGFVTVSYVGATETITPAGADRTRFLQSGQAMFVQTKNPATGTTSLVFHENDKAPNTVNNIFRTATGQVENITINLNVLTAGNPVLVDGIVANFDNAYAAAIDDYDAVKLFNIGESIAFVRNGKSFSIERRPLIKTDDVLLLNLSKLKTAVSYQFEIIPTLNAAGLNAYLVDNYLKSTTPIDLKATTKVNFTITSDAASTGANRFSISFSKPAIVQNSKPGISVYPNPVTNGIINLQISNMPQGIYNVRIFNSLGQTILTRQINHTLGTETINLGKVITRGEYLLEVIKPDKTKFSNKLIAY